MILVTGSSGFIGRPVCAQLSRENLEFIGADQRQPDHSIEHWRACDLTDRAAVDRLFQAHPIDAVVHLAAMLPSACRVNPSQATSVNVTGSANLLEASARLGVKRFVFGSSMSAYGLAGEGAPLCELAPARAADVYGAGKRYIEIYGETLARNRSFSFAALRIATVVGPGARHTASPWRSEIFEKLGSGARQRIAIPFVEETVLSLVYVKDVARMLVLLATRAVVPSQVYNTPAENWTAGKLKRIVEGLDANLTVELGRAGQPEAPPVADGGRFTQEFGWRAPSLSDRLAGRLNARLTE
jgi:nucleoside-diphosphate-sugar epimerase